MKVWCGGDLPVQRDHRGMRAEVRRRLVGVFRDARLARRLLRAAVRDVHAVDVERSWAVLCMPRAPVDLDEQLPVGVQRVERVHEVDHLRRELIVVPVALVRGVVVVSTS